EDDRERQDRRARQAAQRDADVLSEILQRQSALHRRLPSHVLLATVSPRALDVAETANGITTRVFDRHPLGMQFVDAHLQVRLDLLVHLCLYTRRAATQVP